MDLAIVIPYFKISYFEETLYSLANQTNQNFNLYIGNDASPENPLALLDRYKDKLDFSYHEFDENLGSRSLTSQWERCVRLTRDEKWIIILGDDDFISPDLIENFYNQLHEIEKLNIQVVRSASKIMIAPHFNMSDLHCFPKIEESTEFFYERYFGRRRSSLSEYIFRKEAYLKYGFRDFPLGWGADNFAWLEFSGCGKIFSINESITYIRISEQSISRSGYENFKKDLARYECFKAVVEDFLPHFSKHKRLSILLLFEQYARQINRSKNFRFCISFVRRLVAEKEIMESFRFFRRFVFYKFKI